MWFIFLITVISGTVISGCNATISSAKYYIDGSALVIFDGNISGTVVNDVLESTLYSQVLANHAYDRFSDFTQWYAVIVRSFEEVAWTMYSSDFQLILDDESSSNQEAVKKKVLTDFDEKMRETIYDGLDGINRNSSLEKLFSKAISMGNFSNFQVLVIGVDKAGDVTMSYTGFVIDALSSRLRLLFTSSGLGTIKDGDYAVYRKDVTTILGSYSQSLVTEFKPPY